MQKQLRYRIEAFFIQGLLDVFGRLSLTTASNIGGLIGRTMGPLLKVHKVAKSNLTTSIPGLTEKEYKHILLDMWDNLGRTAAEFSHLPKLKGSFFAKHVQIEGKENFELIKDSEKQGVPVILFSGHFANWEIHPIAAQELGYQVAIVYRPANNPIVESMIQEVRKYYQRFGISKSSKGMRKLLQSVKDNIPLAMLMDQKANEGIEIPFFGRPAKTAPAIATLALKYNARLVPVQVIRLGRTATFKMVINAPLELEYTGDDAKDTNTILTTINQFFEEWIKQYPGQWFWVHKRWKK